MARIEHAPDFYKLGEGAEAVFDTCNAALAQIGQPPRQPPTQMGNASTAVPAFVNDSRWIVLCPDCGEAQQVSKDDRRFCCFECLNFAVDGRWRPVTFPGDVEAVEAELLSWPEVDAAGQRMRRNSHPGEDVKKLRKRKMDRLRPSVPRFEDLTEAAQKRLLRAQEKLARDGKLEEYPVIEWADDARTKPRIDWKKH